VAGRLSFAQRSQHFEALHGISLNEGRRLSRADDGTGMAPARAARRAASTETGVRLLSGLGRGGRRDELAVIALRAADHRGVAANALADARAGVFSTVDAAEDAHGLSRGTVRRQFPGIVDEQGRVASSDRASVIMRVVGEDGPGFRVVRGSHARRINAQHQRDLQTFLATGNAAVLDKWQGERVAGVRLLTDPALIDALYETGRLRGGPYPEVRS
jgi:hypothetical protein